MPDPSSIVSATQSGVARVALSSGLPIVASRTGALAEVVQENITGLLFPPGEPTVLAEPDCELLYKQSWPEVF